MKTCLNINRGETVWRGKFLAALLLLFLTVTPSYTAPEPDAKELAQSVLEFGGSVGKLVWVSVKDQTRATSTDADQFQKLAASVQQEMELGRATSGVVAANMNLISTSLTYAAVADPEPMTKVVAGVAAFAAKKGGEALSQAVLDRAQDQARGLLAQGLKQSGLTQAQMKAMKPEELSARVGDFQVGTTKLKDLLADVPGAMQMVQAASIDLATNLGVAAIAKTAAIGTDVDQIKSDLSKTTKALADYQTAVDGRLKGIEGSLGELQKNATEANEKLDALQTKVGTNSAAISALATISYSGWSTDQKIQAVESGLFPELDEPTKAAMKESLQAQRKVEQAVAGLETAAKDFGNLAQIAGNIGLPQNLVVNLQGAQIAATSVAKFVAGDYLGAVAGATSLIGLGGPDAGRQEHAQLMSYLQSAFNELNERLKTVVDLQVKTLQALDALAKAQGEFRKEVLGQLDRIESEVLANQTILQRLILSQWDGCHTILYSHLNGQFTIPDRKVLKNVLSDPYLPAAASDCLHAIVQLLQTNVKAASWAGAIIDGSSFPETSIASNVQIKKALAALEKRKSVTLDASRDFVRRWLASVNVPPALFVAQVSQPVNDVYLARQLDQTLNSSQLTARFKNFACNDFEALSEPLAELICVGVVPGSHSSPLPAQLQGLLDQPVMGPQAYWVMNMVLTFSKIADFATMKTGGSLEFAPWNDVEALAKAMPSAFLLKSLGERKSEDILRKLRWLSEALVLQKSVMSGSHIAVLVEKALYDPATRALVSDPNVLMADPLRQAAALVMKVNPVVARNVVMLAARHAIEDAQVGGTDDAKRSKAEELLHREAYYGLALNDFKAGGCLGDSAYQKKIGDLLPNWPFAYRATASQRQNDPYKNCEPEVLDDLATGDTVALGSGVSVKFADFYVVMPSPTALSKGLFEQDDALRQSLSYRDQTSQALIDRNVGRVIQSMTEENGKKIGAGAVKNLSFGLLNGVWP